MAGEGSADSINAATIELLERRMAEKVVERARGQIFKYYVIIGTTIATVLGFVGWNAIEVVKKLADDKIGSSIQAMTAKIADSARKIEDHQHEIDRKLARIDALREHTEKARDRVDETLVKFEPKSRQLAKIVEDIEEASKSIGEIETKIRENRGTEGSVEQNRADLARVSTEIKNLATQVNSLVSIVQGSAPAGNAGATQSYDRITTATKEVIANTEQIKVQEEPGNRRQVFIQFAGSASREQINTLRDLIGKANFSVPPAERIPTAASLFEVRYFHDKDKRTAEELADLFTNSVKQIFPNEKRQAKVIPLTNFKTKPKEGTLEFWYGS